MANIKGCGVCEAMTRPFVCVNCLNAVHLERCNHLMQLQRKRELLLSSLYIQFNRNKLFQEQLQERNDQVLVVQKASHLAAALQEHLQKGKEELERTQGHQAYRRSRLVDMHAQLHSNQTEMLEQHFPHWLRYQSLTYQHVCSMLQREQRIKIRQVLEILPLKADSYASDSTVTVSICGLSLPGVASSLHDGRQPEATSSALGYLLLLTDLLGSYLGGPLLHEGSFQGSSTVVWQQQTFWNRRPPSIHHVLPLHVEEAGGPAGVFLPTSSTSVKPRSPWSLGLGKGGRHSSTYGGVDSLKGHELSDGSNILEDSRNDRSTLPSIMTMEEGTSGRGRGAAYPESHHAYTFLQRSLACFVQDLVPENEVRLPTSWSPTAWLLLLCELYHGGTGLLEAAKEMMVVGGKASTYATGPYGRTLLESSNNTSGSSAFGASGKPFAYSASPAEFAVLPYPEEEEEEEWDVVQPPLLPPRPCDPEGEMDHWAKAMRPSGSEGAISAVTGNTIIPSLGMVAANAMRSALGRAGKDHASEGG
ncbi:hypothetical protein CEUSTIGMA_g5092.t1 [Chlamydomonas eustigma]|uniref:Uncharacterized protein n=1 Tax=Chlamydomonas eustigma TaxID=1157962 RepID=A0A250X401_9CHLO|nr:hypothetical protein CEUSTIGMA_g5092.t1 [Chlamydomonas eustigma]|eukprot:GAX77649.1 hypothetical protein CEUSTIGMA_g5092.t1 [Chlamydomonas eustigma]